jgi:F-type H+-transporting ATPase subunit c
MDVVAAKQIGAGLATIAFVGSGIGIGVVFGNYISGALRNPGAASSQFTNLYIGNHCQRRPRHVPARV